MFVRRKSGKILGAWDFEAREISKMNSPIAVLNGNQIYLDELVRENARLTVQHEADQQRILALCDQVELLEAEAATGQDAAERARTAENELGKADAMLRRAGAMLRRAVEDLHFVMAGGDACKVCTVKCAFGEGTCKPVWRGEKAETEEAADQ